MNNVITYKDLDRNRIINYTQWIQPTLCGHPYKPKLV